MKYVIFYNPLSHSGTGKEKAENITALPQSAEKVFLDATKNNYSDVISTLAPDDKVVICGGDGTLNRFINTVDTDNPGIEVLYYPTGSGNDFYFDVTGNKSGDPIVINKYLKDLPVVTVNGKDYKFLNGIGYGIDGYCCEVGDAQREKSTKPVNYTSIAIKGLLFHYKTTSATITVDGKTRTYKNVWLAPTMNGRCYGGGMIPTPDQDRLNKDGTLSVMVYYCKSKLKALMVFPKIFKGEHVKHTEMIEIFKGKNITVTFDKPTALQIDGETIKGVTTCTMKSVKADIIAAEAAATAK